MYVLLLDGALVDALEYIRKTALGKPPYTRKNALSIAKYRRICYISGMSLPAIFTVYGGKELRDFLKAPFLPEISRKPRPVPPRRYTKRLLDRAKNPVFNYMEAECFIARELITPKGRIVAFIDPTRNTHLEVRRGCFGYFESVDDPDVARALMRPALGWLRDKGVEEAVGPVGLTPLWPAGLGPDAPPGYAALIESQGFTPMTRGAIASVDTGTDTGPVPEDVEVALADINAPGPEIERLSAIHYEHVDRDDPLSVTPEGIKFMLGLAGRFVRKGGLLYAHSGGEAVGAAIVLPDPGPAFTAMKGSILPFGWLKCLLYTAKPRRAVVLGPFGPDIPAAVDALMPKIMENCRSMGAKEAVFHDHKGEDGPLMKELKRFSPGVSPGYVLYSKKLG